MKMRSNARIDSRLLRPGADEVGQHRHSILAHCLLTKSFCKRVDVDLFGSRDSQLNNRGQATANAAGAVLVSDEVRTTTHGRVQAHVGRRQSRAGKDAMQVQAHLPVDAAPTTHLAKPPPDVGKNLRWWIGGGSIGPVEVLKCDYATRS